MTVNYFICFVSIWAFHHILDTGGLFVNFTTPAFTTEEDGFTDTKTIDSGGVGNNDNGVLSIGDGNEIERNLIRKDRERLKIIDETMNYAKLRLLNNIYFCNNSIYRCLINVDCREATIEEKDYLLGILQPSQEDEYNNEEEDHDTMNNIQLQIE